MVYSITGGALAVCEQVNWEPRDMFYCTIQLHRHECSVQCSPQVVLV